MADASTSTPIAPKALEAGHSHHPDDHHYPHSYVEDHRDYSKPFLPYFNRKRADPSPLAFAALGTGLFILSMVALGTKDLTVLNIGVAIALGYSTFALLVAGIWEFPSGNSFGAALYITLAGFFATVALVLSPWSGIASAERDEFSTAVALTFFAYFVPVVLFTIAALRSSGGLVCALCLIDLTLLFFGLHFYYPGNTGLLRAAGAFCVLSAFVSWYAFLACLLNHETGIFRLPVLGDLRPKTVRERA
ncbi:hypothetical protein JCM8097_002796 [Rhodosporidiobolus ruineniae]